MVRGERMEKCWYIDKHGKAGTEPLDCLKCKKIKNKQLLDKPDDPIFSAFIDGWQFAMEQIAAYLSQTEHPLSQYHKEMLTAIDVRFKCTIDRGVPLEALRYALDQYTDAVLKLVLKGKI
jgi:predicted proteasome-type protease